MKPATKSRLFTRRGEVYIEAEMNAGTGLNGVFKELHRVKENYIANSLGVTKSYYVSWEFTRLDWIAGGRIRLIYKAVPRPIGENRGDPKSREVARVWIRDPEKKREDKARRSVA